MLGTGELGAGEVDSGVVDRCVLLEGEVKSLGAALLVLKGLCGLCIPEGRLFTPAGVKGLPGVAGVVGVVDGVVDGVSVGVGARRPRELGAFSEGFPACRRDQRGSGRRGGEDGDRQEKSEQDGEEGGGFESHGSDLGVLPRV